MKDMQAAPEPSFLVLFLSVLILFSIHLPKEQRHKRIELSLLLTDVFGRSSGMATTTPTRSFFGSISSSLRSRTRRSKDNKNKSDRLFRSSNQSMPNLTSTSSASPSTHSPLASDSTPISKPTVLVASSLFPSSATLSPPLFSETFPVTTTSSSPSSSTPPSVDVHPPQSPLLPLIQSKPTTTTSVEDHKRKEESPSSPNKKGKERKRNLPQAITTVVSSIIGSLFSPSITAANLSHNWSNAAKTARPKTTDSTLEDNMASSISVPHHPSSNQKGLSQISDHNNSHDRVIAPTTIEATTVQDEKSDWTDDEDENDDRGQEPGLEAMTKKKGLFFRKGFRFSRNTSSNNSTSSLGSFLSTQSARFLNNKTPSKTLPTPATTAPATASSSSSSSFLPKKKKQKSKKMSIVAPVPAPVPQCPRMGGEYEEVFDHGHNISVPIVPQTSYSSPRAAVSPTPPICQLDHIVVDVNSKGQELRLPMTVCIRSLPPPPLSPPPPRPAEADDDEDDEDDEDEDEFGMNAQRNEAYAQTRLRALREHQMVLVELMTVLMERERLAGQGSKDPRRSTRLMYSGKRSNNTTTVGSPTPSERYSLMSTTLISPDDLILLNTENALEETRVSSGRREENDGGKESSLTPCKCQLRRIRRRQKREEAARAYLTMVLDLWQMDQNMCHWLSRYIRTIRRVHRSLAYIQNCVALSKPWPEAIEKEDELLHGDDNALDCDPAKGGVTMDELERVGILQTNLLNRIFSRPKVPAASASATSVAASVDRFGADSETVLPKEDERQRMETITRLDRERQKQQPQNELNISTTSRLRRSIRIPRSRSRKSTATPSPLNTPTVNIPVPSVNSTFVASLSTPAQTVPSVSVVGSLPSLETGSIAGLALSKPLPPLPPITASAAATKPFPDPAFVALGDESSSCCMVTRSSSPYPSPSIPSSPSMPVLVPLVIQSSTTSIGSSTSLKNSAAAVDSPPAVLSPPGLIVTSPTIVRRGKSKKLRNGLPFSSFSRRHPTLRRYHQQQVLFPTPTMRSQLGGSSGGLGESCSSVALARESSFPLSELELSVLVGHHLQTLHAANRFLEEFNLQSENASSVMTQFWRAKEVYERWLALFSRKKRQSAAASSSLPQQQQYQQEHLQQQWLRRRQERLSLQHQQLQEKQAQQQLKVQQHQLKLLQQYRELQEQQLQEQIQQQHLQHLQQQQQQQQQGGLARRFTRRSRRATLMATKNTHGGSRSSRSTIMTTTTTTTTASRRARQKPSKTNMTLETKQK